MHFCTEFDVTTFGSSISNIKDMRRNRFRNGNWDDPQWQEQMKDMMERRQRGRIFFGVALAAIGIIWMLKLTLAIHLPGWMTEWPFMMMVVGLLIGVKNGFRNSAWWILCLIGGANLIDDYYPQYNDFILPGALILGGLAIALRPKTNRKCKPDFKMNNSISAESSLNLDVTFGGRKEMITSKDFASGNISVTFAGCELNFMQADITDTAVLDMKVSFGGVEIIVPSHWHIQNEINPSFGSVDDERSIQTGTPETRKTLILRGSCAFGHVEIKSY